MTDAPPDTEPAPPPRRRRWPLLVLAAVVAVAAGIAAFVVTQDDDEPEAAPPVTAELPDPLGDVEDPETRELADLLEIGRTATYHARYTLSGSTEDGSAAEIDLEVWRDGGRLRQDTVSDAEGQQLQTSSYLSDGVVTLCTKVGEADWTCAETEPVGTEQDGVIGSVRDQLAGSSVTPRDDEIDGRAVRCFAFSSPEGEGDICITPEGVPVRVDVQGDGITLVDLDEDVPDSAFEPPAESAQADASSGNG